jgi:hypothetical protein
MLKCCKATCIRATIFLIRCFSQQGLGCAHDVCVRRRFKSSDAALSTSFCRSFVQTCGAAQIDSTLRGFETLKLQHREVSAKTRALHDSCERLVAEKERLVEFADALRAKLAYFDELERIAGQFHTGMMAVDSEHFLPILHRLDECITYAPLHSNILLPCNVFRSSCVFAFLCWVTSAGLSRRVVLKRWSFLQV